MTNETITNANIKILNKDTKENIKAKEALIKILQTLEIPYDTSSIDMITNTTNLAKSESDSYGTKILKNVTALVTAYVQENKDKILFNKPDIEGESKKIYLLNKLALVELKPTMYSYTYNRYGIVEGSELVRLDFWNFFSTILNSASIDYYVTQDSKTLPKNIVHLMTKYLPEENYPLLSNYICETQIGDKRYAIIRFAESIPPLEVVWKKYLVGTMKHTLKNVNKFNTLKKQIIDYEEKFPNDFVRFDWRNPLPDKDECIPDDFAKFYINTLNAKITAKVVSYLINNELSKKGYELVDICYFMNNEGNRVYSEITPDGMRIKKKEQSYDKDLWRSGKEKQVIIDTWKMLYDDLNNIKNKETMTN